MIISYLRLLVKYVAVLFEVFIEYMGCSSITLVSSSELTIDIIYVRWEPVLIEGKGEKILTIFASYALNTGIQT